MQSFHRLSAQQMPAKRFPPCLRRSGYAQARLKLRHLTACPILQQKWVFVNCDTVSHEGEEKRGFDMEWALLYFKKQIS
jgi:hypothetical protein